MSKRPCTFCDALGPTHVFSVVTTTLSVCPHCQKLLATAVNQPIAPRRRTRAEVLEQAAPDRCSGCNDPQCDNPGGKH